MGKIKVREYLQDLESLQKKDKHKVLIMDNNVTPYPFSSTLKGNTKNEINRYKLGDINTFVKDYGSSASGVGIDESNWSVYAISEAVLSQVYNDLGVNSAVSYPINLEDKKEYIGGFESFIRKPYGTISQDLCSIDGLVCGIGRDYNPLKFLNLKKLKIKFFNYAMLDLWEIILHPNVKARLLEYMTPECYDEFINLYLLGVICGNFDRNMGNYFFCKRNGSNKWESIIAIDNESTSTSYHVGSSISNWKNTTDAKELSNKVLYEENRFWTPQATLDYSMNYERIYRIKKLIKDGKLGKSQQELVSKIMEYDLPSTIKAYYDKYHINGELAKKFYDVSAFVWETEKNTLEK